MFIFINGNKTSYKKLNFNELNSHNTPFNDNCDFISFKTEKAVAWNRQI